MIFSKYNFSVYVYVAGLSKIGCIIRNQKDPYQFQCVFSHDPKDRRDFSVYFNHFDGKQGNFNHSVSPDAIRLYVFLIFIFVSALLR